MKKFTTIILAAALMFAVAGQAYATTLETSGEFRGRFWYLDNYKQNDKQSELWDQRLRLRMNWNVSDTVKVIARGDILETKWQTTAPDVTLGLGDPDKEIDFDWAYTQFAWGPATLSIGKQDVTWGPGVYAKSDNRYRAKIGSKFGENSWSFAWDKLSESLDDFSKDWNGYSLGVVMPLAGWKFGVLGVYSDNSPADADLLALDVTADGAFGPAKIVFEGAYGAGSVKDKDQSGLEGYLGVFLPLGPVNCGFEGAYARGWDGKGDKADALSQDYNGPFNSFILFNQFDLDGYVSNYGTDYGVQNALALKASGTFAASKQLSFMAAGVWAQADEKGARSSADMGVEVDGLAKYALTENVTVQAGIGYLFVGDYFGKGADDPLVVTGHAIVTF